MSGASGDPGSPEARTCPKCGQAVPSDARTCRACGAGLVTLNDAYGTDLKKGGFGLLDMIPGVRDLPPVAKVVLIGVIVCGIFALMGR
ncbi:MAG: zinc ribbon domain-containing protein [Deltaproteobacteria bacterium]|nr:zinc ribbon domain-containing protein [Deltaproteobacteria bacterium]